MSSLFDCLAIRFAALLGIGALLWAGCADQGEEAGTPVSVPESAGETAALSRRLEYRTAAEKYRQAVRQDPLDLNAHIGLAQVLLEEGTGEEAIAACRAGLVVDSTSVPLHSILAAVYSREGRYAPAIKALEKAVKFQPDYAVGHANLGGMYTRLGRFEEAEQSLAQASALQPGRPSIRRRLGELFLQTNRPQAALGEFEQVLKLNPEEGVVHYLLGKTYEALGRHEEAWQAYTRASRLDLSLEEAFFRAAQLGRRLGHRAAADSALKAFGRLQQIGKQDRDLANQKKKLKSAVLNTPENPSYHYELGLFFARLGYYPEALNKFDRVLQMRPEDHVTLTRKGNVLFHLQEREAALELYLQALRLAPDFPAAHTSAAQAYLQMNQFETALDHFRRVVELAPRAPVAWYNLARCLMGLKQVAAADSALEAGLQVAGGDQRQRLEALRDFLHRGPAAGVSTEPH